MIDEKQLIENSIHGEASPGEVGGVNCSDSRLARSARSPGVIPGSDQTGIRSDADFETPRVVTTRSRSGCSTDVQPRRGPSASREGQAPTKWRELALATASVAEASEPGDLPIPRLGSRSVHVVHFLPMHLESAQHRRHGQYVARAGASSQPADQSWRVGEWPAAETRDVLIEPARNALSSPGQVDMHVGND